MAYEMNKKLAYFSVWSINLNTFPKNKKYIRRTLTHKLNVYFSNVALHIMEYFYFESIDMDENEDARKKNNNPEVVKKIKINHKSQNVYNHKISGFRIGIFFGLRLYFVVLGSCCCFFTKQ